MNGQPQALSPSSSGRRSAAGSYPTSPEFEFWMVRNPSFPQPHLLSADELFVDGVLLPLHLLSHQNSSESDAKPKSDSDPPPSEPEPEPDSKDGPKLSRNTTTESLTTSKRWNIFKKKNNASNVQEDREREKEKERKKEKKTGNGSGSASAELNINIWPFSRSRSAGNAVSRPKLFPGAPTTRKVNSAPCSRSNSAGESKSRKWPSSPSRAGVHLGRTSPVWQVRRGGSVEKPARKEPATVSASASKVKVLNLNVPMCIGYRNPLSCRSDETSALGVVGGSGGGGGGGDGGSVSNNGNSSSANLFSIRSLFTKKVH